MSRRATYGAGSCENVGKDRWRLRWSEGVDPWTGKHIRRTETITAPTAKEARKELAARTSARHTNSRITLGDLLDITVRQLPVKQSTRDYYRGILQHVPPAARAWTATDVTVLQARDLIEGLTARNGAPLVRKIHTALMSCWRQARLNGWVGEDNPWKGQRLPKVSASAGKVITDEHIAAIRGACGELDRVWFELHLDTGARPGEVLGLRWSAIDLNDMVVTFIDAKHDDTPRPVAISPSCAAIIRAWQQMQRERAIRKVGTTLTADPYLISNDEASAVPWKVNYAGGFRWRSLLERAGVATEGNDGKTVYPYRLYDTRHTHNSRLAAAGIDATTRAERIGNSPATNQRTYSHSMQDRAAAEVMEAWRIASTE